MAIEIERKFLVSNTDWSKDYVDAKVIKQGYLTDPSQSSAIRVRIIDDRQAFITIKQRGAGISRPEFEYEIPVEDAAEIMKGCGDNVIHKTRHVIPSFGDLVWEVDTFHGRHSGLVLAEIELPSEDTKFERPSWLGEEVSEDPRYFNQTMAFDH